MSSISIKLEKKEIDTIIFILQMRKLKQKVVMYV